MISTLLPLETFREFIGFNPWHFWGFSDSNLARVDSQCNPVLLEHSSQGYDRSGRDDIRRAIVKAQNLLLRYVDYGPAPDFYSVTVPWPRLGNRNMYRGVAADADGRRLAVNAPHKYIQAMGVRLLTLVQADVAVAFVDEDGDGYNDLVTIGPITVASGFDASTVAVYFSAADRFGLDTSLDTDRWRVDPITASVSGTNLTIKLRPWQIARPVLYEGLSPQPLNPTTLSNFVSTLDIYTLTTDGSGTTTDTSQGVVVWNTLPGCGSCFACCSTTLSGSSGDPAATATATARVGIRDGVSGVVLPAQALYAADVGTWSSNCQLWCRDPDSVILRYRSGWPLDVYGHIQTQMLEITSYLAAAEMERPVCGCDTANRTMGHLQRDLSRIGSEQELFEVSDRVVKNLFGTRRGHVMAWERLDMTDAWSGLLL